MLSKQQFKNICNPQMQQLVQKYHSIRKNRKQCDEIKLNIQCKHNHKRKVHQMLQWQLKTTSKLLQTSTSNHQRHLFTIQQAELRRKKNRYETQNLQQCVKRERSSLKNRLQKVKQQNSLQKKSISNQIKINLRKMKERNAIDLKNVYVDNLNKIKDIHQGRSKTSTAISKFYKKRWSTIQKDYQQRIKQQQSIISTTKNYIKQLQRKSTFYEQSIQQKKLNIIRLKTQIAQIPKEAINLSLSDSRYSKGPSQIILGKSTKSNFK